MNNVAELIPAWLQKPATTVFHPPLPAWLVDFRKQHWDAFLKAGWPTRRDERWKYADLACLSNRNFTSRAALQDPLLNQVITQYRLQQGEAILLAFVNGHFSPQLSDMNKLPPGVIACSLSQACQQHAELLKLHWPEKIDAKQYPFASLNAAQFADGLFFYVPDHCDLAAPVHLLSIAVGEHEFIAHPRQMIVLGKQSKLVVLEEYRALSQQPYMMNMLTTLSVSREAKLEYYKIQNESQHAVHMANTFISQAEDSQVVCSNFSLGGLFARDDLVVKLQGQGAACRTSGFYRLCSDNQYIDNHVDIDHSVPRTNSEMLYKGVMDKKSRAVFNGRLHVAKDAQKILAYQANHNLLISQAAEVYSKPELEIYADDVKCKHGATIGQLDQDALFYMRARGIEKTEAMKILLRGFADDVLQGITHPGIRRHVQGMVL